MRRSTGRSSDWVVDHHFGFLSGIMAESEERASVLVAQMGARRQYAVPRSLHQLGHLSGLVTDACADIQPWRLLEYLVPQSLRPARLQRLLERRVLDIDPRLIRGLPVFAGTTVIRSRIGSQTSRWAVQNAAFCRGVVASGLTGADSVYCFNGAAVEVFQAAIKAGLRCILDQTAAPWRWNSALLNRERCDWPGWEIEGEIDDGGLLADREEKEWHMADRIICGSPFARETLCQQDPEQNEKTVVVAYPPPIYQESTPERPESSGSFRPLRLLFVGTLQLRKGIQYLYRARERLGGAVEARLVGPTHFTNMAMERLAQGFDLRAAVPRSGLSRHFLWADAFVFPSLSEGSANACHEAMWAGLPLITTENAGSLVEHGKTGFLVPIRDTEALVDAIHQLVEDRDRCRAMGEAAQLAVRSRTFGDYGHELSQAVLGAIRC